MTALATLDQAWGDWPARISASWRDSAAAIIETGRLLTEARGALGKHFDKMISIGLPFTKSTATRLMIIASDETLCAHVHKLPPAWGTLYELTKLPEGEKKRVLSDDTIKPDTERPAVSALRKAIARAPAQQAYQQRVSAGCTSDDLITLADAGRRYQTICADPDWHFETFSDKGRDRAPDRHYATSCLDDICALPVAPLAARDAILHLWCMDWLLEGAFKVARAWGFEPINIGFIWNKTNADGSPFMGLGHWTRNGAEICLLARRGNPIRQSAGVRQVIAAPIGRHSEKPEEFFARVARLTGGAYLELFARKPREGWTCWGDEIPRDDFTRGLRASERRQTDIETIDPKTGEVTDAPACLPADGLDIPDFLRRQPEGTSP
jgi:N6-adenosine-specific RNA methylase IME4